MKAKSRFLGIDDAPFHFSDESVPVVGVVIQVPSYIEGVLTTIAEVDGHYAPDRIASMVAGSRYRAGLEMILIEGSAVGEALRLTIVRGVLPEPLRIAHLIAAGIVRGESRGRA